MHSNDELIRILKQFQLAHEPYEFSALHIGYINDTYLMSLNNRPKYILQRVNHSVFEDIDGLMNNMTRALSHLSAENYSKIEVVQTRTGRPYWSDEKGYWRIMTYLDNSITFNTTTAQKTAFEAGKIIGIFHKLLEQVEKDPFVDTIPDFHNLDLRERQFKQALSQSPSTRLEVASTAIVFAQKMLLRLSEMAPKGIPVRICHNDTKLNNILFSKETGKALCLIDLDTLMKGYFHYDFGDAIRTIVNTAPEDEKDHQKITFEQDLFEAFIEGIATNGPFLTSNEINALPYGAILLPFLHGIRALTDYLEGNIYYKVSYENQNLDRCLSLFDFTDKAFKNLEYMQNTILGTLVAKAN
ncbi:MAG: phosphotransferase [Maribacter sp.]